MVFTEIIAKKLTAHEAKWLPEKSCLNTSVSIRVFSTRSAPDVSESPFFAPAPLPNHPPPSQNRTKAKKPAAIQPKKPKERKATKSPMKAAKKPAKKSCQVKCFSSPLPIFLTLRPYYGHQNITKEYSWTDNLKLHVRLLKLVTFFS